MAGDQKTITNGRYTVRDCLLATRREKGECRKRTNCHNSKMRPCPVAQLREQYCPLRGFCCHKSGSSCATSRSTSRTILPAHERDHNSQNLEGLLQRLMDLHSEIIEVRNVSWILEWSDADQTHSQERPPPYLHSLHASGNAAAPRNGHNLYKRSKGTYLPSSPATAMMKQRFDVHPEEPVLPVASS